MRNLKTYPKRFWLYALILVLMALSPLWPGPRPHQFCLSGNASQMGTQFGGEARWSIRLLCGLYVRRFICRNKPETYVTRTARAMTLWPHLGAPYQLELDAMASAAGVDRAAVLLGNSFIDLGYSASGCRAVVVDRPSGLLHGHNLDWDSVAGLANWTVCMVRRSPDDGRFRTVGIGLPGLVGALDIINEHGVALSLNQLGYGQGEPVEPVFVMLRRLAETCSTYDQVRDGILAGYPEIPFLLTVSSAQERRSGVFVPAGGRITEFPSVEGRSWAGNTRLCNEPGIDTGLGKAVLTSNIRVAPDLQGVLRHPDVMLSCNIYSVIFDYSDNRLYLASGRTPAAERPYREYRLFVPR